MKKTGFWVCIFMIISVLAGLALPRFTCAWQDEKISRQEEEYEAQNVGLAYNNDIIDSVRLFSEGYQTDIDVSQKTIHTEEEIMDNAKNLLYLFSDHDIVFVDDIDHIEFHDTRSFLVLPADSESTYSAIVWELHIMGKKNGRILDLYFDDASGKMISFRWYFPEIEEGEGIGTPERQNTYTENAASYDTWENVNMLLYNGISSVFGEYYELDVSDSLFGENQDTYLEFTFMEEKYGETTVPVWIYPHFFEFNPAGARMGKS